MKKRPIPFMKRYLTRSMIFVVVIIVAFMTLLQLWYVDKYIKKDSTSITHHQEKRDSVRIRVELAIEKSKNEREVIDSILNIYRNTKPLQSKLVNNLEQILLNSKKKKNTLTEILDKHDNFSKKNMGDQEKMLTKTMNYLLSTKMIDFGIQAKAKEREEMDKRQQNQIKTLLSKNNALQDELTNKSFQSQTDIQKLNDKNNNLRDKNKTINQEKQNLQEEIDKLKDIVSTLKSDNDPRYKRVRNYY